MMPSRMENSVREAARTKQILNLVACSATNAQYLAEMLLKKAISKSHHEVLMFSTYVGITKKNQTIAICLASKMGTT